MTDKNMWIHTGRLNSWLDAQPDRNEAILKLTDETVAFWTLNEMLKGTYRSPVSPRTRKGFLRVTGLQEAYLFRRGRARSKAKAL